MFPPPSDKLNSKSQTKFSAKRQNATPIDLHKAIEKAMGDIAFLEEMLQEYLKQAPGEIEGLKTAIEQDDVEDLSRRMHTMDGASDNLNAEKVTAAALRLKQIGTEGKLAAEKRPWPSWNLSYPA